MARGASTFSPRRPAGFSCKRFIILGVTASAIVLLLGLELKWLPSAFLQKDLSPMVDQLNLLGESVSVRAQFFTRNFTRGREDVHAKLLETRDQLKKEQEIASALLVKLERDHSDLEAVRQELEEQRQEAQRGSVPHFLHITNRERIFKDGMLWIPQYERPSLSIGVLVFREKESLLESFNTWIRSGLVALATEVVVYYQEVDDDKRGWLADVVQQIKTPIRIIGSPNNEALLTATQWIIGNSTSDVVLFLEKDWQCLENGINTRQRIDEGLMLLAYDVAHVVRYRHRTNPGNPLYCQEMYQGREKQILKHQENLMCCVHHWLTNDQLASLEYAPYVYKCPALPTLWNNEKVVMARDQKDWWCSRAEYCLWTNNPYMIRKDWWNAHYRNLVDVMVDRWDEWTEHQRALDIEYLFAWNWANWNSRAWTIAMGEGLFTHAERGEHQEINYKAIRAEADEEDRKNEAREEDEQAHAAEQRKREEEERKVEDDKKTEAAAARQAAEVEQGQANGGESMGGQAEDIAVMKRLRGGVNMDEGEVEAEPFQRKGLKEWELHKEPGLEFLQKGKRELARCKLDTPDSDAVQSRLAEGVVDGPVRGNITIVTLLLDLGRSSEKSGMFKRSMAEYFGRFQRILDRGFPMVVFIPPDFASHLQIDSKRILVRNMTVEDLKRPELFGKYFDRLQAIRLSDIWQKQAKAAGWLAEAPQAVLPFYNPLVMSKLFLLQQVAHENPFDTKYLMFLDAGHYCATGIQPAQMSLFEEHMDRFFATSWRYGTATEVHGMTDKAMHKYVGNETDPLHIVRGGVFGGRPQYIDCASRIYRVVLEQTLRDGYMGTEENILAIALARFGQLFHAFDNDQFGNNGDNCASFSANLRRYIPQRQRWRRLLSIWAPFFSGIL